MKLAFICTEKLPSPAVKGGAIQIMLDGIIPFLSQKHHVTIFSITDERLPDFESNHTVKYFRFPRETYETDVAESLKQQRFDVIHVFNRPSKILLYKEAAPESSFVLSLHNDMFSEMKISQGDGLNAIENVDAITTVSQYIKQTVIGRFPNAAPKVHVVYSGVDLSKYATIYSDKGQTIRNELRKQYKLENKQVILFVGRLSKTKGPHLLIQALEHLIKKYPEAVLLIVGGKWFSENTINDYVQSLYDLAKLYPNHVLFTKYIPSEQIPAILLMGDVFVCSSQWHEPLARVHYEAMAAGLPIITTNRGGNAEVINQEINGLLIDDYDKPMAFAREINKVLSHSSSSTIMGKNGRMIVEKHYQFHHVASALEKIYLDVALLNEQKKA